MTSTLDINRLSDTVGAEVAGVDARRLATDDGLPAALLDALSNNGVLLFRGHAGKP